MGVERMGRGSSPRREPTAPELRGPPGTRAASGRRMRVDVQPGSLAPFPALRRPRAVVADDDASMRAVVAEVLRVDGYDVEEAEHGVELLFHVSRALVTTAGTAGIDLVVSDLQMPFCSGIDVLKKLRYAHAKVPVVIMTGGGDAEIAA